MKLLGDTPVPNARSFKLITLRWPLNAKVPTIHGKWKRLPDGRIEATYDPNELRICLMLAEIITESISSD